jgi:hypothetical protein
MSREISAHGKLRPFDETTFTSAAIDKRCEKIVKQVSLMFLYLSF